MPAAYSVADYTGALQSLMPRGKAWPRDTDAIQTAVLKGLAATFQRTDAAANALLVDTFPATSVDFLPEWESALGVPGPLGTLAGTVAGQQAQVVAALSAVGGASIAYFVGLVLSLGFVATIAEYTSFNVTRPVGTPIAGDGWASSWTMTITGTSNPPLEALIRQYAPAHTEVSFVYI